MLCGTWRSALHRCAHVLLMLLMLPVVGGCAGSARNLGAATPQFTTSAQPTATPSATATPAPAAGTGWRYMGPRDLQTIFFAPSDPATAYACVNRSGQPRGPLTVAVSHDSGYMWQFHTTTVPETACQIAVSPHDAQLIAMAASWARCSGDGCEEQPSDVYVTHDAGTTWVRQPPPVGAADFGFVVGLAWVGRTLFTAINNPTGTLNAQAHRLVLAASVDGGTFTRVSQNVLDAVGPQQGLQILPLSQSLFVRISGGPEDTDRLYRTDATAAGLTAAMFRSGGQRVIALVASADGKTLLGQTRALSSPPPPAAPLVASTDGGVTWHALPPFPAAQDCCYPVYVAGAPDGTVMAEISVYLPGQGTFEPTGVFALRPGTRAWGYVCAPPPAGGTILTVSYDAAGRSSALWAPGFGSGLGYHPLL